MTAQTILPANSVVDSGFNVTNSVRMNAADSAKMAIDFSGAGNQKKFTISCWVKRATITPDASQTILSNYEDVNNFCNLTLSTGDTLDFVNRDGGTFNANIGTSKLFRDPSAWYHVVVSVDTTQGTAANRIKMYVNGVHETSLSSSTYPDQNTDLKFNTTATTNFGSWSGSAQYADGYYSELVFIDNAQLAADQFGEFDSDSGIWKPLESVADLTFGTNGFYLDFETDGTNTAFIDSGPDARAVTVTGGVDHSFTQAKFGGSSIFFDGTDDSLDIADSTDFDFGTGNFTFEFWVYKTASGKAAIFETRASDDNDGFNLEFNNTGNGAFEWYDTSIASGNDLPKDGSAIALNTWTHFAVVRNGSSCKMYRDGTAVGTEKDVGTDSQVSAGTPTIGESAAGANDFQGYLDEIRLSSTARYTGNFTAPSAAFTSDSDTVLLIQSKASNLLGGDKSGVGNHLTTTNLTAVDQSTDTCTNNFATMNPLDNFYAAHPFAEGNTKVSTSTSTTSFSTATIGLSTGKWYFEGTVRAVMGEEGIGVSPIVSTADDDYPGKATDSVSYKGNNGNVRKSNSNAAYGNAYVNNNVIGVALNLDDNEIKFYLNGTVQNSGTAVALTAAASTPNGVYFPMVGDGSTDSVGVWEVNFGAGSFTALSSAVADGNGFGAFEYAPPSGFLAICTKNLATNG